MAIKIKSVSWFLLPTVYWLKAPALKNENERSKKEKLTVKYTFKWCKKETKNSLAKATKTTIYTVAIV